MPHIELGNISPIEMITDPETGLRTKYRFTNIEQAITSFAVPGGRDLLTLLTEVNSAWAAHSDQPPVWVTCSDDLDLQDILRKHFATGERPEGWDIVVTGPSVAVPVEDGIPNVEVNTAGGEG